MSLEAVKFDEKGRPYHGKDENLYVEFSIEAVQNNFKTEQEGHPIFDEVPHIRILFPGDRTKSIFRPAIDGDKKRFPEQWKAFEMQENQAVSGTPLKEWPLLGKADHYSLKAMNIHTVEQLASLPDGALSWLGAREWRDKAKSWLSMAQEGAEIGRLIKENSDLKIDLEALKKQVQALAEKAEKSEKHAKKQTTKEEN